MSVLGDFELGLSMVGHYHDVDVMTLNPWRNTLSTIYSPTKWVEPDFATISGLIGNRKTNVEAWQTLKRYIIAAVMTCHIDGDDTVRVYDSRFSKLLEIFNKVYGLPMGSLDFILQFRGKFEFNVYSKGQGNRPDCILTTRLTKPSSTRGCGMFCKPGLMENMDHGYYAVKPQAIKTHMMYVERLLKYDVESNILMH